MRLYYKLFLLILAAVCVQKFALCNWRQNETVFLARCVLVDELNCGWLLEGAVRDARYFVNNDAGFNSTGNRTNAALPSR